jgi:16S rRNA (cytosine967-C5)-methyltransferase
MNNTPSPRTVCARILSRWLISGDFPDRLIPERTDQRNLVQEMVYGTVRWKRTLEWILSSMAAREPDPETKAYLLTGLYQLFRMDNVPVHAALNETVEAAKADLDAFRIRFINGVLRNTLRRREDILESLSKAETGIRFSHPDLLIQRWNLQFGIPATEALCEWNNRRPAVAIRLRAGDKSPEADALRQMLSPHPAAPDHFCLVPPGTAVTDLPGYASGAFYVQDPATQISVSLLELEPGMKLLDACAAPGGKAFACADALHPQGLILAADLHEDRLKRLRENAQRMNIPCIQVIQADATLIPAADVVRQQAPFDRVLLDVPCSNTGVLNRRPDARWRFSEERLASLIDVQRRMLDAAAPLVATGGLLVYSTCSLEPEENMGQVQNWLAANPQFQLGRQRISMPPSSGTDGAFAAQLIRT